jgi:hypothetical protein
LTIIDIEAGITCYSCAAAPVLPQSPSEAALADLRAAFLMSTPLVGPVAAIFDTWFTGHAACSNATCRACLLSDTQCGTWDAPQAVSICNWRYLTCTNGSVSAVDFGAPLIEMFVVG